MERKKKPLHVEFGSTNTFMLSKAAAWWMRRGRGTFRHRLKKKKALSMLSFLSRIQKEGKPANKSRQA